MTMKNRTLLIALLLVFVSSSWSGAVQRRLNEGMDNGALRTNGSNGAATVALPGLLSVATGTAAAPSISFTGDSNTGIYSLGADSLNFSAGGGQRFSINSSGITPLLDMYGAASTDGYWYLERSAPTNILPVYTYALDKSSGLGRKSAGQPSMIASGVEAMRFINTGVEVPVPLIASAGLFAGADDVGGHINAVTAVHGAAAGTRFLTASETILDAQIPAAIARDAEIPNNASFTFAGLAAKPTTIAGYGLTDVASLGANTFTTDQIIQKATDFALTLRCTDDRGDAALKISRGSTGVDRAGVYYQTGGNTEWHLGIPYSVAGAQSNFCLSTDGTLANAKVTVASNTGYVGISTSTPQTGLHVVGEGRFDSSNYKRTTCVEIQMASGTGYPLENIIGTTAVQNGILTIINFADARHAQVLLRGAGNEAIVMSPTESTGFAVATGTAGRVNVIPDGDGTYTIQQTLAATRYLAIEYLGTK